jgi:hypothetical protein
MSQVVDLSLAVNYLPACACLGKLLVFTLVIAVIPPGEEVKVFIPLAGMLYIDRLVTRNMIFDANAILLAVFFANVHASAQAIATRRAYPMLVWGLHLSWVGACLTFLVEPSRIKWAFEKRVQASKLVTVGLMLMVLVGMSYIQSPLEPGSIRACRALVFTLLAFAWIYVVGIHSPHGIEYLKETSSQFVARLAPVLYSPLWIVGFFSPAVILCLAMHWQRGKPIQGAGTTTITAGGCGDPSSVVVHVHSDTGVTSGGSEDASHHCGSAYQNEYVSSDEDVQELFRMAKMNRSRPTLDTVPENY